MKTKRILSFLILVLGIFIITSCDNPFTKPKTTTIVTTVTTNDDTSSTTQPTTTTTTETTTSTTITTTTTTITTTTEVVQLDDKYEDLIKEGIYSGTYYDRITSEILDNPELLKTTLNELVNENYNRRSYDNAWTSLGTVDSYDGHYVECIYTGQRIGKTDHGSSAGLWNREHIWAKAYGFKDEAYDAYSDIQHLRVSEYTINNYRSSSYFDELDPQTSSKDLFGNLWTSTVFEPRDEVKGDIARMLLYMTIKYDDPYKLDLELTDDISLITGSESIFGGTPPTNPDPKRTYREGEIYLGVLSTILKWHYEDPVDSREIHRNNEIFSKWQFNRNPFIDHPEYVYHLYTQESLSYIETQDDLEYLSTHYISYNDEAIDYMNGLINDIGTVVLESQEYIEFCIDEYYKLGQVTKSFITEYYIFDAAITTLNNLIDHSNRDETIDAKFSFLGLSFGNSGELQINGIGLEYSGGSYNDKYGIYATTNQKSLNISLSNLYPSIVSISITADTNKTQSELSGKANWKIKITDSKGASVQMDFTPPVKDGVETKTIDITSLDLSGDLTIVINASSGYSLRVRELTLNVD